MYVQFIVVAYEGTTYVRIMYFFIHYALDPSRQYPDPASSRGHSRVIRPGKILLPGPTSSFW
jgi:hypothetical protein